MILKFIVLIIVGGFFIFTIFKEQIISRIQVRQSRIETRITDEGRFLEYIILYKELIQSPSKKTLIGVDLFNSEGKFGHSTNVKLNLNNRYLHSDFANLLFSTGFLGLILYLYIFYRILVVHSGTKGGKICNVNYFIYSMLLGLFVSHFIDGMFMFFARGYPFFILGGILGLNNYEHQSLNNNK